MKIDVSPGLGVLSVLRYLDYRPWFALAEFVDNSLESFNRHRDQLGKILTVEIHLSKDKVTIKDDAAGIFEDEFERAFRTASPPPDTKGLSEFGMGMKSAACWFGSRFEVVSTAIGENVRRTVSFDIKHIIDSQSHLLSVDVGADVDSKSHGTLVRLLGLHNELKGLTVFKIKDHLGSIYRKFIRDGSLRLRFRTDSTDWVDLKYPEPTIRVEKPCAASVEKSLGKLDPNKAIKWYKKLDYDFGKGQRITGFVALREKGTSLGQSGFALIRRGRLIEGSGDEAWSPYGAATTGVSQRIFGELELTGFDVSHTKTGFRWADQDDEQAFISILRQHINDDEQIDGMPMETEATKGRWGKPDTREFDNLVKVAKVATREAADELGLNAVEALSPNLSLYPIDHSDEQVKKEGPGTLLTASHTFPLNLDGEDWLIEIKIAEDPLESPYTWYKYEAEPDVESTPKKASCTMYLDNPFSARWITDPERQHPLVRIIAALAVAELKFRNHRQADQLRRDFNNLLSRSLSS